MRFFKSALWAIIIFFIIGLFYWALFVPKEEISERIYKTIKEQERRADLFFKKVSFEEVSEGIKYWQLQAQTAMINKSTQIATLQKVDGTFFSMGRPTLKFRCPAAMWDMKKKEIYLDQPVGFDALLERKISSFLATIKTQPLFNLPQLYQKGTGFWFRARNLSWKLSDQKILCTGEILLNKGEIIGYAQELEGDVALEKVLLRGSPKIMLSVPASSPITLEAEAFEILSKENIIRALGRAQARWQKAEVVTQNLSYEQIGKIIRLEKNVKIKYNDIQAQGDRGDYLIERQEVKLSGNAEAEQGDNRLTGNQVLVSLKDQKISLLGKGQVIIGE